MTPRAVALSAGSKRTSATVLKPAEAPKWPFPYHNDRIRSLSHVPSSDFYDAATGWLVGRVAGPDPPWSQLATANRRRRFGVHRRRGLHGSAQCARVWKGYGPRCDRRRQAERAVSRYRQTQRRSPRHHRSDRAKTWQYARRPDRAVRPRRRHRPAETAHALSRNDQRHRADLSSAAHRYLLVAEDPRLQTDHPDRRQRWQSGGHESRRRGPVGEMENFVPDRVHSGVLQRSSRHEVAREPRH